MTKLIFTLFSITLYTNASLLDFWHIKNFNKFYEDKNYTKALNELKALNKDTPEINYNLANILYKLKKYHQAISYYKKSYGNGVNEANRLYNLGNCYFKLKEWDNAIFAYKMALKLSNDSDIRRNLALAYQMKYKKEQKQNKQNRKKHHVKKAKSKDNKTKSKKMDKNITKKSNKNLKKQKSINKFRKRVKKMLKKALNNKKAPVLMYKIDSNNTKIPSNLKRW